MNKSMLMGVVAGIGVATAGGVLGYQFLGTEPANQQGSAVVEPEAAEPTVVARAEPVALAPGAPAPAAPAARPAPQPAQRPATTTAAAPVEPQIECWDEEVTTEAPPVDQHRIAGTAIGAVVGGAIGKDVGDRDLTTAAGAAAGAFIGRKVQERIQENRAETRTVTTIERKCAPVGTPR